MQKFYLVLASLIMLAGAQAQTTVTFKVDMTSETVSEDGVHIAGSFQGWDPAVTALEDVDMDGVYEVSLDLDAGTHEFKFVNGAGWDGVEDVPSACQVEVSGNDNRTLTTEEGQAEAEVNVCFASCAACGLTSVRLRVDMSVESAVAPSGVHVAGDFQGWDPAGTPLADADEDGVWETLISFNADSMDLPGFIVYKFINGNAWTNPSENLSGEECADESGNRILALTSENVVLSADSVTQQPYCFNSCGTCVSPTMVTFRVDMSTQEEVSANGVHVAGDFQGWSPATGSMTDMGDGIWEAVYPVAPGPIQFKFVNGNDWGGNGEGNVDNESVVGDCSVPDGDNRFLEVGDEDLVYHVCYNQCTESCLADPDPADITFRVELPEGEEASAAGVWVIGNFTTPQWQSGALALDDLDMDNVYEATVTVSGGADVLYKFVNGDPLETPPNEESGIQYDEDDVEVTNFELDGCGVPNGFGAYNRLHTRSGAPEILDVVCWNKCSACIVNVSELMAAGLRVYPNPVSDELFVQLPASMTAHQVVLFDAAGRSVYTASMAGMQNKVRLDVGHLATGFYVMTVAGADFEWSLSVVVE